MATNGFQVSPPLDQREMPDIVEPERLEAHAMKAADRTRAYGAVIGKAMTGLAEGRGLVLVLVNLQ